MLTSCTPCPVCRALTDTSLFTFYFAIYLWFIASCGQIGDLKFELGNHSEFIASHSAAVRHSSLLEDLFQKRANIFYIIILSFPALAENVITPCILNETMKCRILTTTVNFLETETRTQQEMLSNHQHNTSSSYFSVECTYRWLQGWLGCLMKHLGYFTVPLIISACWEHM